VEQQGEDREEPLLHEQLRPPARVTEVVGLVDAGWDFTVPSQMNRASPTSALVSPRATSSATSTSRGVSSGSWGGGDTRRRVL
jgi:hypothetical protein